MSSAFKSLLIHGRQSSPVIIGLCIGIALSLIRTPFIDDDCPRSLSPEIQTNERLGKLRDLRSNGLTTEEDYEPRLVLDSFNKEETSKSTKAEKLLRPRYYTTELGIRDKLLVAVISTEESIGTFGIAMNKTLNHHVDKIIFFIDGIGTKKFGLDIPIVGFKDEKPLIKVFRMLTYLHENYLNEFDYFFIVSDRTYVHGRKLHKMVKRISISENVYMGMLMDNPESLYCSIDAGIVLSHSVMQAVGAKLSWCTRNTYSEADTDNLGRCILHATDKPCVSSLQGQQYISYRLREDVEVVSHLQLIGGSSLVREAVTVSNVPEANDLFALHMFYLQDDVKHVNKSIQEFIKEIQTAKPNAPVIKREDTFDVICWDTFNATHIFLPDDYQNAKPIIGADKLDIMSVVNASISHMHIKTKGNLEYRGIEYGHRRLDPTRGVDYILSLIFRDNTSGQTVTRKLEACRSLTEPEIIPMPYVTENNRITLVLPIIQAEMVEAVEFVKRYEAECMVSGEHTFLLLALLYQPGVSSEGDDADVFKPLKDLALKYTREHHDAGSKVGWVSIHTVSHRPSEFALVDLVVKKLQEDTLVLVTKHSSHISNDFLNRVRMNTILNWQVFSAVPFTQYHPEGVPDQEAYRKLEVSKNVGHFDNYNFDHISFYVGDYTAARKSVAETIPIIKNVKDLKRDQPEEYDYGIYGLFLRASNLHVLRAAEPSLKLVYQNIECNEKTKTQSERHKYFCSLQEGYSFGLRTQLSKLVLDYIEQGKGKLRE
ncbi:Chondroitin sulfate synthase 2-like [Homarus americanus]|uniref:Hexosyltransferase n=1 Tax=Homarus americanus TaxID=6706 RepID=A0A8J5K3B9_HOMAM|nr:Chondroitin sulfate synthase 2-like [Homarus americanus]